MLVYQIYRSLPRQLGTTPSLGRTTPLRNGSFISRITSTFRKLGGTEIKSSDIKKGKMAPGMPEKPPSARETVNRRKFGKIPLQRVQFDLFDC
jgi:hypothetical protein